jgi:uncharacterized membrane protein YphA (DoxX/SURF4 family)
MMVAAFKAHAGKFGLQDGGREHALTWGVMVLGLALTGPGSLAVERWLPVRRAERAAAEDGG